MFKIVPRTEIGLPEVPTSTNGSPRPKISDCIYYTAHYTGVYVKYGDPGDTPAEILNLEDVARRSGKPEEYNYVIGTDHDLFVYEYAGHHRAAHSAGENAEAVGVLFFNGVEEDLTPLQILKFRWLRSACLRDKLLATDHEVRPHKKMPGAATACPGSRVLNNWDHLVQPWIQADHDYVANLFNVNPEKPTEPITPVGEDVPYFIIDEASDTYWKIARTLYTSPVGPTVDAISRANVGIDPAKLKVGDKIRLPGKLSI